MFLISSCSCLCPIHWSQMLSWEWRCSWSSADRRCSNYIWVINSFIAYWGATYIRGFTVELFPILKSVKRQHPYIQMVPKFCPAQYLVFVVVINGRLLRFNWLRHSVTIWWHRSRSILWLVAWQHKAITWTNVDFPLAWLVKSYGIHLRANSQQMPRALFCI